MSKFGVQTKKEIVLEKRMAELGIIESDLIETFVRASGSGGQKVNKSSTCVCLEHKPSGIRVKVQKERVQSINRFLARRLLIQKYEEKILGLKSAKQKEQEKIQKQKTRRKRRAKKKRPSS